MDKIKDHIRKRELKEKIIRVVIKAVVVLAIASFLGNILALFLLHKVGLL